MKHKFSLRTFLLIVLGSTALATCAASAAYTFTWFSNQESLGKRINGETDGAYFARGTGAADDPYVINRPFHLYNLAWLQYTGYFGDNECYFIIEKDLDMTGWTLPPIGTTDHPFIGHVNGYDTTHGQGQDHAAVISNLTVSNEFSDYNRHPGAITSVSNVNIIGFFGVVGKIGQDYSSSASSTVPSVKNLYLNNVAVNDKTSSTLIGIAAGYVNGVVEGVGITGDSSLSVPSGGATAFGTYTKNISDYTSVGFCEKAFRSSLFNKEITLQASTPVTGTKSESGSGSDTGWGGSIDMKSMYTYIQPLYSSSTVYSYVTEKNVTVTADSTGQLTVNKSDKATAPSSSWPYMSNVSFYNAYSSKSSKEKQTSSFSFSKRYDNGSVNSRYLYLSGRRNVSVSGNVTWHTDLPSINNVSPQTISDGSGNYLACVSGSVTNSTSSSSDDTLWYISGNQIFTLNPENNFSLLYLTDNLGTLSLSSVSSNSWTVSSNGTIQSSAGRYLVYSSSGWSLTDQTTMALAGYYIYDSNYGLYLQATSSSVTTTSSLSDATLFFADSKGYYYALINDAKYYLTATYSWFSANITVTQATSAPSNALYRSENNLLGKNNNRTYYLVVDYSSLYMSSRSSYASDLTFTSGTINVPVNLNLTLTVSNSYDTSRVESRSYTTNDTYFPLQYDSADTSAVSSKNTGYVVSGANENSGQYADIRISYYPISDNNGNNNLGNSGFTSTSSTLAGTNVYSIDAKGSHNLTTAEISGYSKFTDSLSSLQKVLTQNNRDGHIYGLHFMNASISKNRLITAPYASINGKEYANYQLPEDAIDFQLRDKGYINFFAGTYFSGNDSFFSLHRVFRDNSNSIDDIKEISKIYHYTADMTAGKHYAYVYQYTDGTFSSPYWFRTIDGKSTKCKIGTRTPMSEDELSATTTSAPAGYTSYFDTAWIKKQRSLTKNAVYYFEVPVNEGEYALGSVDGGTGAYLMYLDIGANAQRTDRTTINEIKTTNTYEYSFPNGVSFVDSTSATVTPDESAGLTLSASSYSGTLSISRTDSTIAYTSASNTGISACFIGNSVTLTGNGTTVTTETYVSLVTETEKSQTILDYNTSTDEETKTVYKQDNNGNQTTQINDGEATDGWGDADVEFEPGADGWHTEAIVKNVYINGKTVTVTVDSTYAYNHDEEQNTYYYALTGYRVSVKGDVEVQVTATQIGNNIVVSLLTDPTNNTYVTLTVNVPQTIPASN